MRKVRSSVVLVFLVIAAVLAVQSVRVPALTASSDVPEVPVSGTRIFAYFEDIPGESTSEGYVDWIDVDSFLFSMSKPTTGASGYSRRRGVVAFEDVVCTKWVDKATPKLMEAAATGEVIAEVVVAFTRGFDGEAQEYYMLEFTNVLVTSYQSGGSSGDVVPQDTLTWNFESVLVRYTEYDDDGDPMGHVEWSWEVEEGE